MTLSELIKECFPFKVMRPGQEQAIAEIVKTYTKEDKKFVILEGPTGSGKSVIAYTATKVLQRLYERQVTDIPWSCITVQSHMLQEQYMRDFPVANIWAANHYPCAIDPMNQDMYYGAGTCKKKRCPKYHECEYVDYRNQFMKSDTSITNYSWYLNNRALSSMFVVIDEAHNLEGTLCDWVTVEISDAYIKGFIAQLLPQELITLEESKVLISCTDYILTMNDDADDWMSDMRTIATEFSLRSRSVYSRIEAALDSFNSGEIDISPQAAHRYAGYMKFFKNLAFTTNMLARLKTDWVVSERKKSKDEKHTTVVIKPLDIREVSNMLYQKGRFFLLMSATICGAKTMSKYLGIDFEKNCKSIKMPNLIPSEQRPVVALTNLGKFVWTTKEEMKPRFLTYIDNLIETKFQGVRGIIHSVSYEHQEYIKDHTQHSNRMRFPQRGELKEVVKMLEEGEDIIVVSPSVVEGLDLQDDLCRFIIFFKTPWASTQDKWVATKLEKDRNWYARDTIVRLVQGSGRGARSETDYCITYILDSKFLDLWRDNKPKFPKWYRESVVFYSVDEHERIINGETR